MKIALNISIGIAAEIVQAAKALTVMREQGQIAVTEFPALGEYRAEANSHPILGTHQSIAAGLLLML